MRGSAKTAGAGRSDSIDRSGRSGNGPGRCGHRIRSLRRYESEKTEIRVVALTDLRPRRQEQVDTKCKETVKTKEGTKAATMETIASSAKTEEATALEHSRREHSSQSSGRTSSQRSTRFWMKCLQAMLNRK